MAHGQQRNLPGLLAIPAELRNNIYEEVLLYKDRIDLGKTDHQRQPGLLNTCRQITAEAKPIYYSANKFTFTIHNYAGTRVLPAWNLINQYRKDRPATIMVKLCTDCNRVDVMNLFQWLKAYHADPKIPHLRPDRIVAAEGDPQTLARHAFGVVKSLRKKKWDKVDDVLESFYSAIDMFYEEQEREWESEHDSDEWSEDDEDYESDDDVVADQDVEYDDAAEALDVHRGVGGLSAEDEAAFENWLSEHVTW